MKYQKGFIGGSLSIFSLIGWVLTALMAVGIWQGGMYFYNKMLQKDKEISTLNTTIERNEAAFNSFRSNLLESQKQRNEHDRQNSTIIDESRRASNEIERVNIGREGAADPAGLEERINEASNTQAQQFRDITARDYVPNQQDLEELDKENKE